jgi:hypothetical protein
VDTTIIRPKLPTQCLPPGVEKSAGI